MTDESKKNAQEDIYSAASSSSNKVEYTCDKDGCEKTIEVEESVISIAGGDIYCDAHP